MTPDRLPPAESRLEIDQSLRIIIQRLQDLAHRVDFLESALLPGTPAPTSVDTARAAAARSASGSLGEDLEQIENAIGSVMSSIDRSRSTPTPPPVEPVVVDLSEGRETKAAVPARSSGWRPVATKPRI